MKRVCGFAVFHIVTHYYAASHWVAWSVGLSVALSVCHTSESWKKRLKRSSCHLRSGLGWAQWTTYYMTSTGQHGKGQLVVSIWVVSIWQGDHSVARGWCECTAHFCPWWPWPLKHIWYVSDIPWYLNAKGLTPIGSTCVAHTSPHSAEAVRDIKKS